MKKKTIAIVAVIFVIGFVLGMLTSAQLRQNKLKPLRFSFSEEGLYKVIQPDEKQKAELKSVIDKYAKKNGTLQDNFRKDFDKNMSDFQEEIKSKLTKEQLEILDDIEQRRREMMKEWEKKREEEKADSTKFHGGEKGRPGPGPRFNEPPPPWHPEERR